MLLKQMFANEIMKEIRVNLELARAWLLPCFWDPHLFWLHISEASIVTAQFLSKDTGVGPVLALAEHFLRSVTRHCGFWFLFVQLDEWKCSISLGFQGHPCFLEVWLTGPQKKTYQSNIGNTSGGSQAWKTSGFVNTWISSMVASGSHKRWM